MKGYPDYKYAVKGIKIGVIQEPDKNFIGTSEGLNVYHLTGQRVYQALYEVEILSEEQPVPTNTSLVFPDYEQCKAKVEKLNNEVCKQNVDTLFSE